jgi:uncharacterized protein (DUF305 family)
MEEGSRQRRAPVLCTGGLLLVLACAGTPETRVPVVQAGAPGEASRPVSAADAARTAAPRHVEADARFMRDMIVHHAQAIEMTSLVEARTRRADIRLLARRIEASQHDEMESMRTWLTARGEALPDAHAHHGAAHAGMAGMLSAAELDRLRAATGPAFDRLFLEFMIRHHEGALVMVADLLATDGAGQELEIFQFASHVDADQRVEIDRMRRMLQAAAAPDGGSQKSPSSPERQA